MVLSKCDGTSEDWDDTAGSATARADFAAARAAVAARPRTADGAAPPDGRVRRAAAGAVVGAVAPGRASE